MKILAEHGISGDKQKKLARAILEVFGVMPAEENELRHQGMVPIFPAKIVQRNDLPGHLL
jgi:hypothetical protein